MPGGDGKPISLFYSYAHEDEGLRQKNFWRLYDVHGNVWEWVQDCWHRNYEGAPGDGRPWLEDHDGDCGLRVLRGGSWFDDQGIARSAFRMRFNPDDRGSAFGFRVVCSFPSSGTGH
jgi:formylglycine-generating enzyme required for sulfatase activity